MSRVQVRRSRPGITASLVTGAEGLIDRQLPRRDDPLSETVRLFF